MGLCYSLWTLRTELTNSSLSITAGACSSIPSTLPQFNRVFTLNKQNSSVSILMRWFFSSCFVMLTATVLVFLLSSHSGRLLSSLSLIPSSTGLYKWGPCSYQGYQFVWNIRPVRVRAVILSGPRLLVSPLLLCFTHAFHSRAFISFLSQWAEKHRRRAEGKKRKVKEMLSEVKNDSSQGECRLQRRSAGKWDCDVPQEIVWKTTD